MTKPSKMTSTEDVPAVPRRRPWRRGLPRVIVESALIVFSVLLALAVDEWRDNRSQRVRTEAALAAILSELEANRAAMQRARDLHESIATRLQAMQESGTMPTRDEASSGLFRPARVISTAWASAREAGALDELPYDLVLSLSRLYGSQERYEQLSSQLAADIYMDLRRRGLDPVMREGFAGFLLLVADFSNRETVLVRQYDELLPVLKQHKF